MAGMAPCCPPGHGCNSPNHDEPCALVLCSAAAEREADAALALARWEELQQVADQDRSSERRFRRRAFERARDRALQALAMQLKPAMLSMTPSGRRQGGRVRQ